MSQSIHINAQAVANFCEKYHIRRLSLFGSVLREDFGPDSDIDMLVEFLDGHVPGVLKMSELEQELTGIIGRRVDLRTPAELSRYFRDQVMRECRVQYVAT